MAKLKTGRHTSAIKELRKSKKRNSHNRFIKSTIRSLAKQVEKAIVENKPAEAKKLLSQCFAAWDKAAKVKVIHKNTASRKKSRLSTKVSKLS